MHEQCIDLKTLAKWLSLSRRTIRAWVHDPTDPLPAYRVGGKLLFHWRDVEDWLRRHQVKPLDLGAVADHLLTDLTATARPPARRSDQR